MSIVSIERTRMNPKLPALAPRKWIYFWGPILLLIIGWFFSGGAWTWFRPVIHKEEINRYAAYYHFDPLWVMAIIKTESGFASSAHSPRGAVGLMQILPSTAHDLGPELGMTQIREEDLQIPDVNLHLGVFYLSKLQRLFPDDDIAVLAAYNAGLGVTQQWRQGRPALDPAEIPYPETQRFVRRVQKTYAFLKMIQHWKILFGMEHGN